MMAASSAQAQLEPGSDSSAISETGPRAGGDDRAEDEGIGPRSEAQQLLDALQEAPNAGTAEHIERSLLQAWTRSGSDTVDLLMGRAAEAMERNEYPVALELLTTVVEIKPDYAEGWNRRATLYYLMDEYALSVADIRHTLVLEPRISEH
jgi:tetratricopeptide (TPR) repeat protein